MMRIPCPWCGVRDESEFRYSGEATRMRPASPENLEEDSWAQYLHYHDNVKGLHLERWVHNWGCRQWFLLERDSANHEIKGSRPLDDRSETNDR